MTYIKGHKHSKATLEKIKKGLKGRIPWNKLDRTTRKCPMCNKIYDVPIKKSTGAGYRKFCSKICQYKDKLGKKTWNYNIKTGIIPSTAFKKGCKSWNEGLDKSDPRIQKTIETRRRTHGYRHTEKTKIKIRKARAEQKFPFNDTKIEIILQNLLKTEKIRFKTQKYNLPGTPDIFIEPNICIFADGDYWHNTKEAKIKDIRINEQLKKMGYKVLRFWEHEILTNGEKCLEKIIATYGQRKNL